MDDITNILSITQMRLNKFKVILHQFHHNFEFIDWNSSLHFFFIQRACGSLTNLLKIRGGSDQETDDLNKSESEIVSDEGAVSKSGPEDTPSKVTGHLCKLDSLLTKTENAHYSMAHQNQQMKTFLQ